MKQTVGELVYKITGDVGNLQASLKKSEADIKKLQETMNRTETSSLKAEKGFKGFATAVKAGIAGFATGKLISFLQGSVLAATELIEQQTKLAQILRVSTNATDEDIRALRDQAEALEKIGVLDKEVVTGVQAQLATFDVRASSIKTLTPAILDYVAAEKGANATVDEARGLTNGLAQALGGNFASLTKVGFVLDDSTKKLISQGTETERVEALTKVLNSTYEDVNKTLAGTFLGTMKRTQRAFGDFREDLGFALMPALQVLGDEFLSLNDEMAGGSERVNKFGKIFYRVAQGLIVVGKSLKIGFNVIVGAVQTLVLGVAKQIEKVMVVANGATEALGLSSETLKNGLQFTKDFIADVEKKMGENLNSIEEDSADLGTALKEAIDPQGFQEVTDAAISKYKQLKGGLEDVAGGTDEASKALESFQDKMIGFIEDSKKVVEQLEGDLSDSFKTFGTEIGKTFEETNKGLAKIVVDAEKELVDLKKQLRESDDSESRKEIKNKIKEQEAILKARKDFEEKQVAEITAIRAKLDGAGIDSSKITGLDNVKTLEDQIVEERRLQSLDAFSLFVEQQNAKITKLTDDFIIEVELTRGKIEQQKALEQDLTDFFIQTTAVKTAEVDAFAANAIAKYGAVASALKSLQSQQAKSQSVKKQFAVGGYVGADGGNVHSGEYVVPAHMVAKYGSAISALERERSGSVVNNNRTVNAPINIQANVTDGLDFNTLSREMAWQLGQR